MSLSAAGGDTEHRLVMSGAGRSVMKRSHRARAGPVAGEAPAGMGSEPEGVAGPGEPVTAEAAADVWVMIMGQW